MPTRTKKKTYLEFRYSKEESWNVYDWTQIEARVSSLYANMVKEFPGAEYRTVSR